MQVIHTPSRNYDSRQGVAVDMLVLHYTDTRDCEEALAILQSPESKVSSHYVVDVNGAVHQLVPEDQRAWHAGISYWRGNTNINHRSIGIEIVNTGHRYGITPYAEVQMQAVVELCRDIITRHAIAARNVVGHSDVAPTRKLDPGEHFNWQWLAGQGVGLWPASELRVTSDELREPVSFLSNSQLVTRHSLADYGYDISDLPAAIRAFQRHFRPEKIDGIWDEICENRLAALVAMG